MNSLKFFCHLDEPFLCEYHHLGLAEAAVPLVPHMLQHFAFLNKKNVDRRLSAVDCRFLAFSMSIVVS